MSVIPLPSNRPPQRFYRGGEKITDLRAEPRAADHEPEDWVASTTTIAGEPLLGLTRLPDGRLLADAVAADPEHWLGPDHVARYGADTKLLVKLLDAGQRLPVHAHPPVDWAAQHLGRTHGKAEAWYILEGGPVHVGLRREVLRSELADLVDRQDTAALLGLLHRVDVGPGDVVYVPPGVLHAIGEGVFLLELQEPEDLSILLEWDGFELDGRADGHLGLGFDVALGGVEVTGRSPAQVEALIRRTGRGDAPLPAEADGFFRLERHRLDGELTLDPGFAVLLVASGAVSLADGGELGAGTTTLVPHAAGALSLTGAADLLVARPPRAGRLPVGAGPAA